MKLYLLIALLVFLLCLIRRYQPHEEPAEGSPAKDLIVSLLWLPLLLWVLYKMINRP